MAYITFTHIPLMKAKANANLTNGWGRKLQPEETLQVHRAMVGMGGDGKGGSGGVGGQGEWSLF